MLNDSRQQLTRDSNPPRFVLCKFHIEQLEGFKIVLVENPVPTEEHDVKVMDILKTNMYLLCMILVCWFWHHLPYFQPRNSKENKQGMKDGWLLVPKLNILGAMTKLYWKMGVIWCLNPLPILNIHLYLTGVWLDAKLRTDTKKTCDSKKGWINYMLKTC